MASPYFSMSPDMNESSSALRISEGGPTPTFFSV